MKSFQDVFERREQKYIIDKEQCRSFLECCAPYLRPDEYANSMVMSLYYDTDTLEMINRSLDKPVYKQKLRLRAYGTVQTDEIVFIEIKKKFQGIVYKRRVGISYLATKAYMSGVDYLGSVTRFPLRDVEQQRQATSLKSLQISREIDYLKEHAGFLRPAMLVCTHRYAYTSTDGSLRITFDRSPTWRREMLDFDHGTGGTPLLSPSQMIMEIKAVGPYPLQLVHLLDELQIYPCSCSKYGRAYLASCIPTQSTGVTDPLILSEGNRRRDDLERVPLLSVSA